MCLFYYHLYMSDDTYKENTEYFLMHSMILSFYITLNCDENIFNTNLHPWPDQIWESAE